ncbi:MAG: hypothetical protein OQL16_06020 [Gammaproteobacteria bacterium]|nr:hypothetical protein [Gammaproteobacteria bacterium]
MQFLSKHILEILLVVISAVILYDLFWPDQQTSPVSPQVQWADEAGSRIKQKLSVSAPATRDGSTNMTSAVKVAMQSQPLQMDIYQLQKPLLPDARLLDIVRLGDSFWFSSDRGLLEFNMASQQWWLRNKSSGLPGDTAYDIEPEGNLLFMTIYDWGNNGKYNYLTNARYYTFDPVTMQYHQRQESMKDIRTGGHYTTDNSDLIHNRIGDAIFHNGKVWITSYGDVHREKREFVGGGISVLDPESKQGRRYTTADGLSSDYCYDITVSDQFTGREKIWVTHFDEEKGLSLYHPETDRWQAILTSKNGIELGGVVVKTYRQYVIIGQQRGLVFYDTNSQQAFILKEKDGLPGYIVTGIHVDGDDIWISAYSYASGGKGARSSGLIRISGSSVAQMFDQKIRVSEKNPGQRAIVTKY